MSPNKDGAPSIIAESSVSLDELMQQNSNSMTKVLTSTLIGEPMDNVGTMKLKISSFKNKQFKQRDLSLPFN